jgi:hypothetical protein
MRIAILVQDILQANTLRAVLDRKNLDQSVLAYHVGRRKTPIFVHFEGFKLPLQIRYNYLVAPGRRRVAPSFAFGAPLLVPFSFNFPLYCFGGTSCDEKRNVIVSIRMGSVMASLDSCVFDVYILCPMISLRCVV